MRLDWREAVVLTMLLGCAGCEQRTRFEPVVAGTQCRQIFAPQTQDPVIAPNYDAQCLMPGSQWVNVASNPIAARNLAAPIGTIFPAPANTYWITEQSNFVWPFMSKSGDDQVDAARQGTGIGLHYSR